jgi:carbamoylphosphate synthase small subunit
MSLKEITFEASPGLPHDSYLFDQFIENIKG